MAAQGYFIVAVNPTGSTGYGKEFTDRIQNEWGSRTSGQGAVRSSLTLPPGPFKDLLAGYHAALKAYPEIDSERTAALGGSYGGYMVNWIQGHNSQFGFKALVCHDGIFDTTTSYFSTEELWFTGHEFGGDPTVARQSYERSVARLKAPLTRLVGVETRRWNPMNHVAKWSTPELIIHGGKDFRLDNYHALSAFTALQIKGVPSRYLYFPNENHWVLAPKNSRKWHHEVFKWLDEWIGEKK